MLVESFDSDSEMDEGFFHILYFNIFLFLCFKDNYMDMAGTT